MMMMMVMMMMVMVMMVMMMNHRCQGTGALQEGNGLG
jgi:hypothetical protein